MAREYTDGLYIDLEYFTPEEYYVYIAEARLDSGFYIDDDYIEYDYYEDKEGNVFASLSCELTEVVGEVKEFAASLSSSATSTTDAVKTVDVDSSISSSATQTVTPYKIMQLECNAGALFTPSVNAVAKINMTAILDSTTNLDAIANRTRDNDIALQNAVNLSLQAAKTASAISALQSEFAQTVETARTRDAESLLAVSASVVVDADVISGGIVNLSTNASLSVSAEIRQLTNDRPHNKLEHLYARTWSGVPQTYDPREDPTYTDDGTAFQFDETYAPNYYDITSLEWYPDSSTSYSLGSGDWYISFYYDKNVAIYGYNETTADTSIFRLATNRNTLETIGSASPVEIAGYEVNSEGTEAIEVYYDASPYGTNRDGDLKVNVRTTTGSITLDGGAINDNWSGYITIYRSNGTVYLKVGSEGGSVDDSATLTGTMRSFDVVGVYPYNRPESAGGTADKEPIVRDVIAKAGTDSGGVVNDTTNDEYTLFYYPLNGTLQDDTGGAWTWWGEASLSTTATLTAQGINLANGASLQASSGTLTVSATTFSGASASLASSATLDITETYLVYGDASLSSTTTLTVDAVKTTTTDASLASIATLPNIDYIRYRDASVDTDAIATQLTAAAKIGDFFVNIEPSATLSAVAVKRTEVDSAQTVSFVQTVSVIKAVEVSSSMSSAFAQADTEIVRIRSIDSVLEANATQTTVAVKTVDIDSAQSSQFTQSADVDKFSGNEATMQSNFTQADTAFMRYRTGALDVNTTANLTANAIKTVNGIVNLSTASTLSVEPLRIRPGVIDTDAIASQLTAAAKIGDYLVTLEAVASLSVDAVVTTGNTVAIQANASLTADNDKIRPGASSQSSEFTQTVDPIISVSGEANITTNASLSVSGVIVADAVAELDGVLDFDATVRANLVGEIPVDVVSTLTVTPSVTRTVDVALSSESTQTATVSKQVPGSASLSTQFAQTVDGRLIVFLEQLTYTIPSETRSYSIRSESRGFIIDNENRTFEIRG